MYVVLTDGTRFGLVTKRVDDFRAGTHKRKTCLFDFASEFGIFSEETVSA